MYYKIKDDIIFRQYEEYGYISDNSLFGYHLLNDNKTQIEEEYVSKSGSIMLSVLNKQPQHIDDIVAKLIHIFIGVNRLDLKNDALNYYDELVHLGFLSSGKTVQECNNHDDNHLCVKDQTSPILYKSQDLCSLTATIQPINNLRSLHIEIASECNEQCVHCYIPHEFKNKLIEPELFYNVIQEGRSLNILNVSLSGGEPLLHNEIVHFLQRCRELDLSVNILSNLTLLTDEILAEMKLNPLLSVQTSVYSMIPEIHDGITHLKGSLNKTIHNIEKLLSFNIPVQISCPIMKQNKNTFYDVINWGLEHNIDVKTDYVIFATYDHSNSNLVNRLSISDISEIIDKQLSADLVNEYLKDAQEKELLPPEHAICTICKYTLCISVEGNVYPCVGWQNNVIGNLHSQNLKTIWETSEKIKRLREIKRKNFSKCLNCEDRGYCTICMMSNSNESLSGNAFDINEFHCKVANLLHTKICSYKLGK